MHPGKDSGRDTWYDSMGEALVEACEYDRMDRVKMLVKNTNILNSKFDRYTPLAAACVNDSHNVVKFLIESGADVNQIMSGGSCALMVAVMGQSVKSFHLLIKNKANINALNDMGTSVLSTAVAHGNFDAALTLIKLGANCFTLSENQLGAIDYALTRNYYDRSESQTQTKLLMEILDKAPSHYKTDAELIKFYTNLIKKHNQDSNVNLIYKNLLVANKEKLELGNCISLDSTEQSQQNAFKL